MQTISQQIDFDRITVQVTSVHVWPDLAPGDKVLYRRTARNGGQFYAKAVLVRKPADMQRKATISVRGRDANGGEAWQTKSVETYTLFRGNWVAA